LKALSVRTAEQAQADLFSGAVLVARHGRVLFSHAYGLADREHRRGCPTFCV
jgi:CubicO group peptidase (beta-lactamase class C family)